MIATGNLKSIAVVGSYGKWRWALKGAGWTNIERRVAVALVIAIFVGLAALEAFYLSARSAVEISAASLAR